MRPILHRSKHLLGHGGSYNLFFFAFELNMKERYMRTHDIIWEERDTYVLGGSHYNLNDPREAAISRQMCAENNIQVKASLMGNCAQSAG